MVENQLVRDIRAVRRELRSRRGYSGIKGSDYWPTYSSYFGDYRESFRRVLRGVDLLRFVMDRPSPVVVDLMSPSDTVRDLFTHLPPDKPRLGITVSLADRRSNYLKEADAQQRVIQIAGDLTRLSTWEKVKQALAGRKVDLIMERAMGGIWGIPLNKEFYATAASRLYALLAEDGGTLLAQLHSFRSLTAHGIHINEWVQQLRVDKIVAHYAKEDSLSIERYWGAIRITRTPKSPPSIAELLV